MSSPKADFIFFQDDSHFTSKFIDLPESFGLNGDNISAYLENGISLIFSNGDYITLAGFINYIDNNILNPSIPMSSTSSSLSFNLPEGIINVIGSVVNDTDAEGFWTKPTVHTIIGGAGNFLGKTGYAVVEPLDNKNKDSKAFVWKVFFTN